MPQHRNRQSVRAMRRQKANGSRKREARKGRSVSASEARSGRSVGAVDNGVFLFTVQWVVHWCAAKISGYKM